MTTYLDTIVVLGIAGTMLLIIDWRIGKAFMRHERIEQQNFASVQMTSEAAAGAAQTAARHLRELREDAEVTKGRVVDLAENVRMHDRRLGAVEERVMRAALLVPVVTRRSTEEPE